MSISSLLFSATCAGCGRSGDVLCRNCRFALVAPPQRRAESDVIAAVPFAGRARDVLLGYKYGNRRQLAHHFAGLVVNRILASGYRPRDIDVVTWAPTGSSRRHRRGFDQAEVVARRVAAQLGVPCRRLLVRCHGSGPQTGRSRHHRLLGPVFRGHPAATGKRILVVDDVVTTGATLRSAAAALDRAGAAEVVRAAVASTPAFEPAQRWSQRRSSSRSVTPVAAVSAPTPTEPPHRSRPAARTPQAA